MFNNRSNRCGCGCGRGCGCGNGRQGRRTTETAPVLNCEPVTYSIRPECAVTPLDMRLEANTNCAMPCEFVTYTLTITNNCTSALVNPILNFDLGDSLCYRRNTLTVDGTVKENVVCLKNLQLDNIEPNATVTITLEARVMTCDRYVVSYADLSYSISCCCSNRCFRTVSNGNLVQVCQCCSGAGTTTPPAAEPAANTTETTPNN